MICDSCSHRIFRRYQNGDDVTAMTFCDMDGYLISYQLKECTRKEEVPKPEPEVKQIEEQVVEVKKKGWPEGKKRGT